MIRRAVGYAGFYGLGEKKSRRRIDDQAQGLCPENLTWVHNVVGVDRLLDRAHDAYCLTVLGN
jgi:hypothetical protein